MKSIPSLLFSALVLAMVSSHAIAQSDPPSITSATILRCDRDNFVVKIGSDERQCPWSAISDADALKLLTAYQAARDHFDPANLDAATQFKIAAALCRIGHQQLGRNLIPRLASEDATLKPQADQLFAEFDLDPHIQRRTARVIFAQHPSAASYSLETRPSKHVDATLNFSLTASALSARQWLLVAPMPPALPCQNNVAAGLSPNGTRERELSSGRAVLTSRYSASDDAEKKCFTAVATYCADLFARRLVNRPTPPDRQIMDSSAPQFLGATSEMDFDSPTFSNWLLVHSLRPADSESEVDFARRTFATITKNFSYEYTQHMDRKIVDVCAAGKSDCGGLSMLFVSAMRASAIPARLLVGRWARSARDGDRLNGIPYYQWHVKAEFFAAGIGWIPVDCSSEILHDRSPQGLRFFANDPGDFLVLHLDRDLTLDTPCGQKTMGVLQDIAYWASGSGNFDGKQTQESWKVAEQPLIASTQ